MFKKLLVAYDGSEDSRKALEMALELSRRFDSEVHLLTIIEQLPRYAATIGEVEEALAEITKVIEKEQTLVCEGAREKGVEIHCRILPGHEVEAIIAYAQRGVLIPSSWAAKGVRPSCGPRAAAPPFRSPPIPPARLFWPKKKNNGSKLTRQNLRA